MAELTVKIPIPNFTKALYDQAQQSIVGRFWRIADLCKWLGGRSHGLSQTSCTAQNMVWR